MGINFTHMPKQVLVSGHCRIPIDSNMDVSLDGIVGHVIFSKVSYGMEGNIREIEMEALAISGVKLVSQILITTDLTVVLAKKADKAKSWETQYA